MVQSPIEAADDRVEAVHHGSHTAGQSRPCSWQQNLGEQPEEHLALLGIQLSLPPSAAAHPAAVPGPKPHSSVCQLEDGCPAQQLEHQKQSGHSCCGGKVVADQAWWPPPQLAWASGVAEQAGSAGMPSCYAQAIPLESFVWVSKCLHELWVQPLMCRC